MLELLVGLALLGAARGLPSSNLPGGRILGGNSTDISQHPYQLALLSHNDFFCGGVLISDTWGITAAHCFDFGIPFNLRVRGGSTYKSSGGEVIDIDEVLRHPEYNAQIVNYDAALIRLARSFTVENAKPIRVPELNHPIHNHEMATVTGWGATKQGGDSIEVLQQVRVPVVSMQNCRSVYGSEHITNVMFCAGYLGQGGRDACNEDAGGPLVIGDILAGLVSWGKGCGERDYPSVYTRVPSISNWILEVLERSRDI
ncbi:hypothetical protein NQ315_014315 [Exocentrus adspersus]|uniref:Peptidase S1 domain-containing protein n=1 Tax=Exocentrus adspersus TaxID=1586481 RepID=A0AAV8VLM2_9CUCU|nr:hypothetical protein NQ315_014315 [Exocentrus adspersus]